MLAIIGCACATFGGNGGNGGFPDIKAIIQQKLGGISQAGSGLAGGLGGKFGSLVGGASGSNSGYNVGYNGPVEVIKVSFVNGFCALVSWRIFQWIWVAHQCVLMISEIVEKNWSKLLLLPMHIDSNCSSMMDSWNLKWA